LKPAGVIVRTERDFESALVGQLRAGDLTAFDAIYDAYNPRLFSFLLRMTKNRAVAEDLLEETWLRLVSSGEGLAAATRLGSWLFTVARNLFLSYYRSRARERAYTRDLTSVWPGAFSRSPYDSALLSEFEQRLEAALAEVPPMYREVLLLIGFEGLRPSDAAAVCGITPEALRQRLSRGRKLLSQRLKAKERSHDSLWHHTGGPPSTLEPWTQAALATIESQGTVSRDGFRTGEHMTESHDPLLEAVAGLRTIAPDANWEKRVRAHCHSQISQNTERQLQAATETVHRLTLVDLAAVAFLFVYLSALLREAARLGGFL
jgi:RNA polymerase sigma-70 factor (ECF subfamily)